MVLAKKIKYSTHIGLLTHLPGMHYIPVGMAQLSELGSSYNKRLLISVNGEITFPGGLVALGEGTAYISISKARMKKLGITLGSKVEILLEEDNSLYGMEMSEELNEVLVQDKEGNRRFHQLTKGKQRYIIQYVSAVKNTQLRIERALKLIGNLIQLPEGNESFREILGLSKYRTQDK